MSEAVSEPTVPADADRVARVYARRERHRSRPLIVRALSVVAGGLLVVIAVGFVWFPEVGLPVLVAGLSLLGLEYEWAARALSWTVVRWGRARRWWSALSTRVKAAALVAGAAGLVAAVLPFV